MISTELCLTDSDFSVKKDEMQTQSMFPAARRGKENAVSTTTVNATSVLPERKIIHETAVVHPDAFIGEVSVHLILPLVEFYIK